MTKEPRSIQERLELFGDYEYMEGLGDTARTAEVQAFLADSECSMEMVATALEKILDQGLGDMCHVFMTAVCSRVESARDLLNVLMDNPDLGTYLYIGYGIGHEGEFIFDCGYDAPRVLFEKLSVLDRLELALWTLEPEQVERRADEKGSDVWSVALQILNHTNAPEGGRASSLHDVLVYHEGFDFKEFRDCLSILIDLCKD